VWARLHFQWIPAQAAAGAVAARAGIGVPVTVDPSALAAGQQRGEQNVYVAAATRRHRDGKTLRGGIPAPTPEGAKRAL